MRALAKLPRVLLQRCATPPRTRTPLCCGTRTRASMADDASAQHTHAFGPHVLRASEVFVESRLSLGFVNLKPVVPGHVLFIPRRVVPRAAELTSEEIADLWLLAHRCAPKLEAHFGASALTFAVQDGAAAGQTVPHVHIHLLPRRLGDFENNDEVYDLIDDSERQSTRQRLSKDLDRERVARTPEEMAREAETLRRICQADA